jgi:hypothetical protein
LWLPVVVVAGTGSIRNLWSVCRITGVPVVVVVPVV